MKSIYEIIKDNQLLIEETEAKAVRMIFEKFAESNTGLGGVARYLNMQGIKKITRQNGEYSCAMKSHFRKTGNQMSGRQKSSYASLLA